LTGTGVTTLGDALTKAEIGQVFQAAPVVHEDASD
jgi:hypothetical protein